MVDPNVLEASESMTSQRICLCMGIERITMLLPNRRFASFLRERPALFGSVCGELAPQTASVSWGTIKVMLGLSLFFDGERPASFSI